MEEPWCEKARKFYASNVDSLKCTNAFKLKLKFSGLGFGTIRFTNKMLDKLEQQNKAYLNALIPQNYKLQSIDISKNTWLNKDHNNKKAEELFVKTYIGNS